MGKKLTVDKANRLPAAKAISSLADSQTYTTSTQQTEVSSRLVIKQTQLQRRHGKSVESQISGRLFPLDLGQRGLPTIIRFTF